MLSVRVKSSFMRSYTISNLPSCGVFVWRLSCKFTGSECKAERIVRCLPVVHNVYVCLCMCAHACFCAVEFNHACARNWCVFTWVCARLCLCADVRSEEEVAVFV